MRSVCAAIAIFLLGPVFAGIKAAQLFTGMRCTPVVTAGLALTLLFSSTAAGQSPPPLPSLTAHASALGTADDALAWLRSVGFGHVEYASAADGTSRWVATLPMSGLGADVSVKMVGSSVALASVTLETTLGAEFHAGSLIVMFMQRFAPDEIGFVVNALLRGVFVEGMDAQAELADGTITVAMARAEAALESEETIPIAITIERSRPSAE
jgi:hypothetical protein